MQVLGWLVIHGTDFAVSWQAVRLVRVVLDYRVRCKEMSCSASSPVWFLVTSPRRRRARGIAASAVSRIG